METRTIRAAFSDLASAESAVGRLEVGGVPRTAISVRRVDADANDRGNTIVVAEVELRLVAEALGILSGEGRVDT